MRIIEPEIGCWYESARDNSQFEVVALDEERGTIEIQHASGELEEIESDEWYRMEITDIPTPEDWDGPFEKDSTLHEDDNHPENWNAVADFEPEED